MQHNTPFAVAVGVEVGTSGYTASIGGDDKESDVRHFDVRTDLEAVLAEARTARADVADGPGTIAFAVPTGWEVPRRHELEAAAERAGFANAAVVSAPEAAAHYSARAFERDPKPGSALVVSDLGADSYEVAIVQRADEAYAVVHSARAPAVGGNEFDQLLLAYLSGRYSDTDPAFWRRIDDPRDADAVSLRTRLLDEIRLARERVSSRQKAGIPLPIGDRDLLLTRTEVESCIGGLIAQCADLAATTIESAGVAAADLLLVGGASRTPLLAAALNERTGLTPHLPDSPETVVAEGARLVAEARAAAAAASPRRRTGRRLGVLAAVVLPLVAGTVVFGFGLGTDFGDDVEASESTAANRAAPTTVNAPGNDDGPAEEAEPTLEESESQEPGDGPSAGAAPPPTAPSTEAADRENSNVDREEQTTSGAVPAVTELSVAEAKQALSDAGFTKTVFRGEQQRLFGPWYADCEVFEQDPPAGEQHAFADQVTVTYSYMGSDGDHCGA